MGRKRNSKTKKVSQNTSRIKNEKSEKAVSQSKSKSHKKISKQKSQKQTNPKKFNAKSLLYSKTFWFITLLLVSMFFSTQVRLYSWSLKGVAYNVQSNYENYVKNNIRQQILQKYIVAPPASQLNAMVNQEYAKLMQTQGPQFQEQLNRIIAQTKEQFRNYHNETFLLAIDPYYWYRYIRNKVNTGHFYDTLKNGKPWDNHMLAPLGMPAYLNYHVWVGYLWYKLIHPFTHLTVMGSFFFVPVLIMIFVILVAFYLGDYVGGPVAGFFFSLLIGLNGAILARTSGGFSDTDVYNILFPLLISWFMILTYEHRNDKGFWLYGIITAFWFALFTKFWSGWWFIFDISLGAFGLLLLYQFIVWVYKFAASEKKFFDKEISKDFLESLKIFVIFLVVVQLFLWAFHSPSIVNAIQTGFHSTSIKASSKQNLWPNVYTTVAELNYGSFSTIRDGLLNPRIAAAYLHTSVKAIQSFNSLFILLALIGMAYLVYLAYAKKKQHYLFSVFFFFVWFVVMSYATLKGIRFAIFIVTPYAFFVTAGLLGILDFLRKYLFSMKETYFQLLFFALVVLLIYPVYGNAQVVGMNNLPSMSRGWYNSLTYIKNHSQKNAIINSWWDFGHWFKAIADRAVTFDGGTQNTPMAHWIGKVLQTDNTTLALKILRMLDCGSNNAFNVLNGKYKDTYHSIVVLYQLLGMNKAQALAKLRSDGFNETQIKNFSKYMYCKPPEDFFITSQDMVGKAGVWAHFGLWNFKKAKEWVDLRGLSYDKMIKMLEKNYSYSAVNASKIAAKIQEIRDSKTPSRESNNWISSWPSYIFSSLKTCKNESNNTLVCPINVALPYSQNQKFELKEFVYNTTNVSSSYFVAFVPQSTGYVGARIKPGVLFDASAGKEYDLNNKFELGVAINPETKQFIIGSNSLMASTFTRLFYFEHDPGFKKVYETEATGTGKVIVWKVDWNALKD